MQLIYRRAVMIFGVIALLAVGAMPARAGLIATETTTVTPLAGGNYLYSYLIMVSAQSTVPVTEFDLGISDAVTIGSIVTPSNFFTFYTAGFPTVSFVAFDDGISAGSSGTFSFISSFAPSSGSSLVRGFDSSSGTVSDISGMTVMPSAVPEPSSVLLCGLGLAGLLGGYRLRSRRSLSA